MNFWTNIVIPIGSVIVATIVAIFVARKFGDLAGTNAAIEYEKEKDKRARRTALRALWNGYIRIRDMAHHNIELQQTSAIQGVVKMPVTTFEAAFLSRESPLLGESEGKLDEEVPIPEMPGNGPLPEPLASRYRILASQPLAAVTAYLTAAHSLNMLVDVYMTRTKEGDSEHRARGDITRKIKEKSQRILEILKPLDDYLAREMGIPPEGK